jgi:CRISPR system Cascade subunit CasA
MTSFNLIREPWIPVTIGGSRSEVSLFDALARSQEIDGLSLDDPLQAVALFRQVILPVALHAFGPPRGEKQWQERWEAWSATGVDQAQLGSYFTEHEMAFDLFDSTRPFAQAAGLRTSKDETKPVSVMMATLASGNNVPLFSARTEANPPALTPAEAVRAVLAAQCWDTAAIKSGAADDPQAKAGKTTGNPTGPVGQLGVVIPLGQSLAQTLLLNSRIMRQGLKLADKPQWATTPRSGAWSTRPAEGILDLLTWQSRRIRLIPSQDEQGRTVVSEIVLTAGDRLQSLPLDVEPHTAWRIDPKPKADAPPRRPMRHQPGRAAWRGMTSLLATKPVAGETESSSLLLSQLGSLQSGGFLPKGVRLQVLTAGVVYGNQSAVIEDIISDSIPLPVAALAAESPVRALLLEITQEAEELRHAANNLGDDLRRAGGADKLPWDKGLRLGEALVMGFTPLVQRLLAGLQNEPQRIDDASKAWRVSARSASWAIGDQVLNSFASSTFAGRENSRDSKASAGKVRPRRICPSTAELNFRAALNRILGPEEKADRQIPSSNSGVMA